MTTSPTRLVGLFLAAALAATAPAYAAPVLENNVLRWGCDAQGGRYCGAGAVCGANNQCEVCGGANQLCCLGRFCDATRTCMNNRCN